MQKIYKKMHKDKKTLGLTVFPVFSVQAVLGLAHAALPERKGKIRESDSADRSEESICR